MPTYLIRPPRVSYRIEFAGSFICVVHDLWTIGKWSRIKRTGTQQHNRVTLHAFRRALCKVYTVVSFCIDVGPQRTLPRRLPPLDKN